MQTTEYGLGKNSPPLRTFNGSRKWGVVIKRLMRARGVVVLDVFGENPNQVGLAENDDLVEAVPAK